MSLQLSVNCLYQPVLAMYGGQSAWYQHCTCSAWPNTIYAYFLQHYNALVTCLLLLATLHCSAGNCSGHCQGGNGFIPETYSRIVLRSCGGVQCPYAHGQVRNTIACINNDTCPPQNCVGSWVWDGACNGTCGGGAGIRPEKYVITVPAMYNGTQCPEADATIRATTACTNTNPCPIDCVGNWSVITGNCTGACQGGQGFVPEMFNITVPAQYGGVNCNYTHGTYRYVINCTNNNPCPPRDCQGTWTRIGNCTGGCGGVRLGGRAPERFSITLPAAYGGNNCTDAEGDIRTGNCTNTTPCVNIPCNATCKCG